MDHIQFMDEAEYMSPIYSSLFLTGTTKISIYLAHTCYMYATYIQCMQCVLCMTRSQCHQHLGTGTCRVNGLNFLDLL